MYLAHILRNGSKFKKGDVYFVDSKIANTLIDSRAAEIYPLDCFDRYKGEGHMLAIRTGGFGDIIAMSSILDDNCTLVTQPKMFPVVDYFQKKPFLKDITKPIWNTKQTSLDDIHKKYKLLLGDEDIDNGSRENWYDIFGRAAHKKTEGRPRLIKPTSKMNRCCVIVSQSSNANRNADTQALVDVAKLIYDEVIVAHEQKWTTKEYFENLCEARMVISTDTSAIHFREGIGRAALGLYGAFSNDSRTKYYANTFSINIQSPCNIQPCFSHAKNNCKHLVNGVAGCLSSDFNPNLRRQVIEGLKMTILLSCLGEDIEA